MTPETASVLRAALREVERAGRIRAWVEVRTGYFKLIPRQGRPVPIRSVAALNDWLAQADPTARRQSHPTAAQQLAEREKHSAFLGSRP